MQELFLYLLKSSGLIAAFFLSYHFLLRKETFFTSNRWFLLAGLVTSVLLPLFFIKKIVFVDRPKINIPDLAVPSGETTPTIAAAIAPEATIDWLNLLAIGYVLVAGILILKLLFDVFSLFRLLHNRKVLKQKTYKLVDLQENIAPFSFFNLIVFNSKLYSEKELESILLHEKVHSRQKHSYDVLIAKLFTVLFWFNPFAWLYKRAIVQNLEYIADHQAIQYLEDKKIYQKALLKVVTHQNCIPITNHFYQSLIKKRILMLNKNQSRSSNAWKYSLILPALIGFVFLFQVKTIAQESASLLDDGTTISSETREVVDMTWTKNSTDEELNQNTRQAKEANVEFIFSNIKRNPQKEIVSITISCKDDLGNDFRKTFSGANGISPIHFIRDIDRNGKGRIGFFSNEESNTSKDTMNDAEGRYVFDKRASDKELQNDALEIAATHNIQFTISNVKRNKEGEIIAIKMAFDDHGIKGKTEQNRTIPIRPIFFKVGKLDGGKREISFYDNHEMISKPKDKVTENKIATVESITDEMLILVDGHPYSKEDLDYLDPKGLEKIEILTRQKAIARFGNKAKNGAAIVTTNWAVKTATPVAPNAPVVPVAPVTPPTQQKKVIIFQNDNGDDIVFIPAENSLKIPRYPSIHLKNNPPVLLINGVEKSNPFETLEQMDLQKIKSVRGYDEKGKETPGTAIKKLVITTK